MLLYDQYVWWNVRTRHASTIYIVEAIYVCRKTNERLSVQREKKNKGRLSYPRVEAAHASIRDTACYID